MRKFSQIQEKIKNLPEHRERASEHEQREADHTGEGQQSDGCNRTVHFLKQQTAMSHYTNGK